MATRTKVSEREYLAADGTVVDSILRASGGRYSLVGDDGKTKVATFDQQFGEPGRFATMCAVFGFHTKLGNVANTVLNDKDAPGSVRDAADGVQAWLDAATDATDPQWTDRAEGAGPRVNPQYLAQALGEVSGKGADAFLAKAEANAYIDLKTGAAVSPDAEGKYPKGSMRYCTAALRNPAVKAKYDALAGKSAVSVDIF